MAKEKNPRRCADNEAMAVNRMLRVSPQKLNLVAAMIRGKPVGRALSILAFSPKRIAEDVNTGWISTNWSSPRPGSARGWC